MAKGFQKGKIPWNKGLTKETDPRVVSPGRPKGFIPWNKGQHWKQFCVHGHDTFICGRNSLNASCNECVRIKSLKQRTPIRQLLDAFKDKPCADCGIKYPPYVMDFDHKPEFKKEFQIAKSIILRKNIKDIENKVSKCDVVCSNCHRIRTWKRQNN